jgi:hypothetical protein
MADAPHLAIVSDRAGAVVSIDGVRFGSLHTVELDGQRMGAAVIEFSDWKWHKIQVVEEGIRASGPGIVRAASNAVSVAVFRFAPKVEIGELGSHQLSGLPVLREGGRVSSPKLQSPAAHTEPHLPPHIHTDTSPVPVEPRRESASRARTVPAEPRTGTMNVGLPKGTQEEDLVRLVVIATGETIAQQRVKANDMAIRFSDIPGMRLYLAELIRDGDVVGASAPEFLGKKGIWTPFMRIRLDPIGRLASEVELPVKDSPSIARRVDADFSVDVLCPPDADFSALCRELRRNLTQRGIRWASSVTAEEIDAYLTSYGYPEGGPALRGEPVARNGDGPVVYPGKIYVFVLRAYKLARNMNSAHVLSGDSL